MGRTVDILVEDRLSEAVLRRLIAEAPGKLRVGAAHPMRKTWEQQPGGGYGYIKKSLAGFNVRALTQPVIALVDADDRCCPPETISEWLGGASQHPNLVVRVAVREVEAWLLADRGGIADFLSVKESCLPRDTERIRDPKRYVVRLAARSRRSEVRNDIAPARGTQATTGPYFTRALASFAGSLWDVAAAESQNASLRRARAALAKI
jgi:hypothetical protein